jgi:peptide-methionine (R)-S-oxide reductase
MSFCSWSKGEIYKDHFESGIYVCSECDHPLFSSHTKYEHQTPWPAFTNPLRPDSLSKKPESQEQESSKCYALKVSCGKCGNGLGHEFIGDGPGGKGSRF